jgi:hypothetical protein
MGAIIANKDGLISKFYFWKYITELKEIRVKEDRLISKFYFWKYITELKETEDNTWLLLRLPFRNLP